MPVKISASQFHSYNKSQPYPKPKPPYELFPHVLTLSDGRVVRVSVPVPDRLVIVVDIVSEIYGPSTPKGCTVAPWVKGVGDYLKQGPHNSSFLKAKYFPGPPSWYAEVDLAIGARDSFVRFEFKKANAKSPAHMRVVMNPRKLGIEGFKVLIKIFADPLGPFAIKPLLQTARYTDIDVAVDIVGIQTSEIVAHWLGQGKRSYYVGSDGLLETINIHRKVSPSKPSGKVAVSIYDRKREKLDTGKKPPFGAASVTRVEVATKSQAPKNALLNIGNMSDPFKKLRVGYAADQFPMSAPWAAFLSLVRTMPRQDAADVLGLAPGTRTSFLTALKVPNSKLVVAGVNWEGWKQGLVLTGLQKLIDAGN